MSPTITLFTNLFNPTVALAAAGDIVGTLSVPTGLPSSTAQTKPFITSLITLVTAAAGIYVLWQLVSGGLDFITAAGDKGKIQQATQKITMAITGLAIIAGSFIIIAVLSFVLFGKADFILNPTINSITP